ncbi:uncharacterized protein CLUP02_12515 [Colletotrichum lupini]|uniref:Uncharacterized protein n=1 Tax=Colletotrichum lupini TaxID=145971 RepID=A0A9Q8T0M0_9PEZI|nr:uncharacterized protein CLUP02_12515 [Colletotrichum lupini]UQC87013.1 hypothetical protein CLUP02_12515 [Colletotrichum lupini]
MGNPGNQSSEAPGGWVYSLPQTHNLQLVQFSRLRHLTDDVFTNGDCRREGGEGNPRKKMRRMYNDVIFLLIARPPITPPPSFPTTPHDIFRCRQATNARYPY